MLVRQSRGGVPVALAMALMLLGAPAPAELAASPRPVAVEAALPDLQSGSKTTAIPEVAAAPPATPVAAQIDEDALWGDDAVDEAADRDPLERGNRAVFKFNEMFEGIFWRPLTKSYQFAVPDLARIGVRRFFKNLNSPSTMINDILQGRPADAGKTLGRFVLNTTLGFGGFYDAARQAGEDWEGHDSDFGQTLALAGVGSGPYVMIPVLGPNTVRDSFGGLVDLAMQPLTYFLLPVQLVFAGGAWGLAVREEHAAELDALRESSLDFYSTLRSAYFQTRKAQIWGDSPPEDAE